MLIDYSKDRLNEAYSDIERYMKLFQKEITSTKAMTGEELLDNYKLDWLFGIFTVHDINPPVSKEEFIRAKKQRTEAVISFRDRSNGTNK